MYLDWIVQQFPKMKQQLIDWSSINSGSTHLAGLAGMLEVLKNAFAELNGDLQILSLNPMQKINARGEIFEQPLGQAIHIRKRPTAPIQVLLCGHMDTVYDEHHPFQKPVFIDENTVNGPGVADMKGGLLIMLYGLLAFEQTPYADKLGFEIIINPDEEIGSYGSASLLAEAGKRNHVGLVFEPAMHPDGTLAGERKGTGNFVVVAHGKASHAGRAPQLGRNAIRALADFISKIDQLNGDYQGATINVGRIEGGGATNIVPDLAIAYIDVRTKKISDEEWLMNHFQTIIAEINQRDGIRLELHGNFSRKPKPMTDKTLRWFHIVQQVAKELNLNLTWQPSGGCCDGNNLAAVGLPVVDTLGVRGGNIHSSEEYILLNSLTERAQLLALLLTKLATQEVQL